MNNNTSVGGEARLTILDTNDNVISKTDWISNLMSFNGAKGVRQLFISGQGGSLYLAKSGLTAGSNSKPLFQSHYDITGTCSWVGNTITAPSHNFNSLLSEAFDCIKFPNGDIAVVTSVDSDTQVTVRESNNLINQTAKYYHTNNNWDSINTSTSSTGRGEVSVVSNLSASVKTVEETDFRAGTGNFQDMYYSYETTVFNSQDTIEIVYIFDISRIVLETPLVINPNEKVVVEYRHRLSNSFSHGQHITENLFSGWPLELSLNSASSDGTTATFNTVSRHPYEVGDTIVVTNTHPIAISASLTSDGTLWTVTANAHNFSVSDTIVIEDTTNYNGNFIVNTVIDVNTFTISNTNNFANETGEVYLSPPLSYFNDTFTVTGVPNDTTIEVGTTLPNTTLPSNKGRVSVPNSHYRIYLGHSSSTYTPHSWINVDFFRNIDRLKVYPNSAITTPTDVNQSFFGTPTSPYNGNSFVVMDFVSSDDSGLRPDGYNVAFRRSPSNAASDWTRIKQIVFKGQLNFHPSFMIEFDHVQTKFNNFDILFNFATRFFPDLP